MAMKIFAFLCLVAFASCSVVDVHPYSLQIAAEELGEPDYAADVASDLGLSALQTGDDDAVSVVDNFLDEGLLLNEKKFDWLGRRWEQLKKKIVSTEKSVVPAKKNSAKKAKEASPFSKQAHHGLSQLEYKYMRLFQKYRRLHKAYKRGCARNRFWLRLNKWHWRVLLGADKRLRRLVHKYRKLRHNFHHAPEIVKSHFRWLHGKHASPLESYKFLKQVIGLSKRGIAKSASHAARGLKEKEDSKKAAATVALQLADLRDQMDD